jgi:hypothetical protein
MLLKTLFLIGTILLFGFAQSALAFTSDITLTSPIMVNISGQKISDFHIDQQIGIESNLTNNGKTGQGFTYLVQVLDSNGRTNFLEGFSASMLPNQSFTASQVWIPKEAGQYTVKVFVWDSLASAVPLTNVLETSIKVN